MTRFNASIPPAYFENIYAADPDPWRFAASAYERDKYAATLTALPRAHYRSGLEVGCSIGVLTRQLALRCDTLLSVDVAEAALDQARDRCAGLPHVRFERLRVPEQWPEQRFDLILLSEVVYYLDAEDVKRLASRIIAGTVQSADIVLVHWLGETHYPLTGDAAAEQFIAAMTAAARVVHRDRTDAYRLDVLRVGDD